MSEPRTTVSPLLSVEEAAVYLGMSKRWVYQSLKKFCPGRKIGGALKFLKGDLDRFIEQSASFDFSPQTVKSVVAIESGHGKTFLHNK